MRIELNSEATARGLELQRQLNRSVNEIVNLLVIATKGMEITETLTVKLEREPELVKPREAKLKVIRSSNTQTANL